MTSIDLRAHTILYLYHLLIENTLNLHGKAFYFSLARIFTKILKPLFSFLRTQFGHNCLGYIDDSFYTEDTKDICRETTLNAVKLFTSLGFVIHTKSIFNMIPIRAGVL